MAAKDTVAVVLKTVTVKRDGKLYGPKTEAGTSVSLPATLAEKLIADGSADAARASSTEPQA